VYYVYNEIRTFVSAYVWMTGFGNFLYFDKKQDFSIERMVSMWLRINYFPLLLSFFLGVPLELYYVVPLHTAAFFITMVTCYVSKSLEQSPTVARGWTRWQCNGAAIALCLLAHVLFYETRAVNFLKLFSNEYHFRFQSDKYTAWGRFQNYINWCYNTEQPDVQQRLAAILQRIAGVGLIAIWWILFGHISDKFTYNPMHPYVFWLPLAGWLMLRNSSKYLTEVHCGAMEFFGRITLETYVLQFHVFMCKNVQHIPVVIPGAGPDGSLVVQTLNMLVCGILFVSLSCWARQITITTQTAVTDLVTVLRHGPTATVVATAVASDHSNIGSKSGEADDDDMQVVPLKDDNDHSEQSQRLIKSQESDISPPNTKEPV
jgi:N-acetylneuraminate 9-O-acetyltransferase